MSLKESARLGGPGVAFRTYGPLRSQEVARSWRDLLVTHDAADSLFHSKCPT